VIERHRAIFIHIPKTAGMAVSKCLYGAQIHHHKVSEFDEYPASYWRFSFVRNPYTRLLSGYNWYRKGGASPSDKAWAKVNLIPYPFSVWVMEKLHEQLDDPHFKPMTYWLDGPLHFIGRYERLDQGVKYIQKCLGMPPTPLPIVNASFPPDMEDYTPEAKAKVREIYEEDFRCFRYG